MCETCGVFLFILTYVWKNTREVQGGNQIYSEDHNVCSCWCKDHRNCVDLITKITKTLNMRNWSYACLCCICLESNSHCNKTWICTLSLIKATYQQTTQKFYTNQIKTGVWNRNTEFNICRNKRGDLKRWRICFHTADIYNWSHQTFDCTSINSMAETTDTLCLLTVCFRRSRSARHSTVVRWILYW